MANTGRNQIQVASRWRLALSALLAAGLLSWLAACGGSSPRKQPGGTSATGSEASQAGAAGMPGPGGRFEEPGELDRLVDAKPLPFPAVKPAAGNAPAASQAKSPAEVSKGKGRFRVQVGAENDIDAAQAKKKEYERILGGTVDVVFDAPYYKLRWGYFETKQDADDKILELSEHNIQGFVVKQ